MSKYNLKDVRQAIRYSQFRVLALERQIEQLNKELVLHRDILEKTVKFAEKLEKREKRKR